MFRIKKEAPILYKAFIEKQREKLQAEWKEQEKIERGTRKEVSYDRTKEIYVTSLFHGCGTTYLSTILATFLSNYYEGKICLIETKGLKEELTNAAISQFGSGYGFLVKDKDGNLSIVKRANQNSPVMDNLIPILTIDVWEHAYYLKYKNLRADYAKNIWHIKPVK